MVHYAIYDILQPYLVQRDNLVQHPISFLFQKLKLFFIFDDFIAWVYWSWYLIIVSSCV